MKIILNWNDFISESNKIDSDAKIRNRGHVILSAENEKVKDNKDHFPYNSHNQAVNALSRVQQYEKSPDWYDGSLEELKEFVIKKVHSKYPEIEIASLE
jgi:hypothetical protein